MLKQCGSDVLEAFLAQDYAAAAAGTLLWLLGIPCRLNVMSTILIYSPKRAPLRQAPHHVLLKFTPAPPLSASVW